MKKLLRKLSRQQDTAPPETGGRITNETVAEHREKVLAGGRKFKYPLQYTKHRLLIISVAIVIVTAISFFGLCAWQLYGIQSTDKFMYRLTQVMPVPVAKVGDDYVRYSDYLVELRSAIHYLTTKEAVNFNSDDGKRQLDYQKRLAMDKAIQNTLVARLARDNNVSVTQKQVDDFVKEQISNNHLGVSEDVYKQVISDYYDWSFDEYKNSVKEQLLRKEVMAKLDVDAHNKITTVAEQLKVGQSFEAVAKVQSEDVLSKAQGGDVGVVNKNTSDPNGLIAVATTLQPGQNSDVIEGVDGFYIVKLIQKADTGDLQIAKIFVAYRVLDAKIAALKKDNKIVEYIHVQPLAQPSGQ